MQKLEVIVDFNGIVVFDPSLLAEFFTEIKFGENLYRRFTTTDDGDKVVEQGIIIPVLGINDSIYKVYVRFAHEDSPIPPGLIILSNASFPFRVRERAVIADMATLLEWTPEENWQELDLPKGNYSVCVNGFRQIENNEITDFGFEIVFTPCETLPQFTGSLAKSMQVQELP
jgi:hypothetical protein